MTGVHNYAIPTESRDGDNYSAMGGANQGAGTLNGYTTTDNVSAQSNNHVMVNNNSSFAADPLNGTQPLSDWVIERLNRNN